MYKTRIKLFLVIIAAAILGMVGRLGYLQIVRGDHYRLEAEKALQSTDFLPAMRGQILDREGRILAADKPCFDFCLDYRLLTADSEWAARQKRIIARSKRVGAAEAGALYARFEANTWELARRMASHAGSDLAATVERIKARVEACRRAAGLDVREQHEAHPVVTGLDEAAAVWCRAHMEDTVGACIRPSHERWYPYGSVACHVIGTTGQPASAEEMRHLNRFWKHADRMTRARNKYLAWDYVGKSGVEKMCESTLRGCRGFRRLKLGTEVLDDAEAVDGRDVRLSIDIELQRDLTDRLSEAGTGALVVLSVKTGEVLALVSYPVYDLNRYRQPKEFASLVSDRVYLPLRNRAVATLYPPGSTFKPLVGMAALRHGLLTRDTLIHCQGYLHSPDRFRCYKRSGHGDLAIVDALRVSCNVFFYVTAERVGSPRLIEWLGDLGFAAPPGTGLPEEKASILPTEDRIRQRFERGLRDTPGYVPADARFLGIGQGLLAVTPLHVAAAVATVARGGEYLSPKLVLQPARRRQVRRALGVDPADAQAIRDGMYAVVNEPGGTAYKYFRDTALSVAVCGKTGTAQTVPHRIDSNANGQIDRGDRQVRWGDMAWFVGFAPYEDPQIAFAVVVEYVEGGAGANAAPVAVDLIRLCQKHRYLP
jgi:penicillin-binding protein 2